MCLIVHEYKSNLQERNWKNLEDTPRQERKKLVRLNCPANLLQRRVLKDKRAKDFWSIHRRMLMH